MDGVSKLVKKNAEMWGEIRGAHKYTMAAQAAQETGNRAEAEAYLYMAGQDLEHKDQLRNMAETSLAKA